MDFKEMSPEVAMQGFGAGFDCSACTLAHAAEEVGLDEETAKKIAEVADSLYNQAKSEIGLKKDYLIPVLISPD